MIRPPAKVGDLKIATTESKLTKKRGITIDQGDGYVTFQCGGWLERLIEELRTAECCANAPPPTP